MDNDRIRDWRTPVFFVLAVLCVCLVSYCAGRVKGRRIGWEKGWAAGYEAGYAAVHPSDTLVRVDTLLIDRPVPVVEWRDREKLVYVPVNDTTLVTVHDTTFIALEREHKRYEGEEYEAQVSGVAPELDWIRINQKTKYITTTKTVRKHWGLGVTAGPGVLYDGNIHGGVGIVAGLQYQF